MNAKLKDATTEREQFLRDVLTTAVEGGTGYWGRIYDSKRSEDLSWVMVEVAEFEDVASAIGAPPFSGYDAVDAAVEAKDPRVVEFVHIVDTKALARTLRKICSRDEIESLPAATPMRKLIVGAYMALDAGDIDADAADVIMQLCALGEVRYG